MKKIITICCVLGTAFQLYAQGTIIPNGITMFGNEVNIETFSSRWPTVAVFSFDSLAPSPFNIFGLNVVLTPGVRIFSVQENDPFTLQGIQLNTYNELISDPFSIWGMLPIITCEEGVPFYLGFYTGDWFFYSNGNYPDPVLGWGLFENVGGIIKMIDSGLEYGGEGIKIGTLDIINIPEPTTCALFLFGLAGFLGCRKRVHSQKS